MSTQTTPNGLGTAGLPPNVREAVYYILIKALTILGSRKFQATAVFVAVVIWMIQGQMIPAIDGLNKIFWALVTYVGGVTADEAVKAWSNPKEPVTLFGIPPTK